MNILTNWIFWVIIAAIVFVLALIGYLAESRKKNKKLEESNTSADGVSATPNVESTPASNNEVQSAPVTATDFNVMPEVNSTTVSQPSEIISNSNLDSTVFDASSSIETPAAPVAEQTIVQESAPVVETPVAPVSAPVAEQTTVQESAPVVETPVAPVSAPVVEQTTVQESVPVVETPAAPVVETPVAPVEPTIEPASVFTATMDQVTSSTPNPVPAEPESVATPTPIPADVNAEVKAENQNNEIETL